jgi:hypothetical protein
MTTEDLENIRKRIFVKVKFDNEKTKYGKMTMLEKFDFIKSLASDNIDKISKTLKITGNIQFEKVTPFKNMFYFTIYTLPKKNHPIIGYISRSNTTNELILIRPIGKKKYNLNIDQLDIYLSRGLLIYLSDIYALYLSIIKSIIIRKEELIINDEFSLFNCKNIIGCVSATKKAGLSMSKTKKAKLPDYKLPAINVITKYFKALENYNFTEAERLLGSDKNTKSEINKVFRNTKKIRGHLEIFIVLYKFIQNIERKYNTENKKYKKLLETKKQQTIQ